MAFANYRQTVMADSPTLYWREKDASGSVVDETVNGNTGTTHGTLTYNQASTGIVSDGSSRSFLFDGSSAYVSSPLSPFTGLCTFEVWFNRASSTGDQNLFSASSGSIMVRLSAGTNDIKFFPDTGTASTNWASAFTGNNVWVHFVLTMNDTTHVAEAFVNGLTLGGPQSGMAPYATNTNLNQGIRGTSTEFFNGSQQELAVYTGVTLSSVRIAAHYRAGVSFIPNLYGRQAMHRGASF